MHPTLQNDAFVDRSALSRAAITRYPEADRVAEHRHRGGQPHAKRRAFRLIGEEARAAGRRDCDRVQGRRRRRGHDRVPGPDREHRLADRGEDQQQPEHRMDREQRAVENASPNPPLAGEMYRLTPIPRANWSISVTRAPMLDPRSLADSLARSGVVIAPPSR